MATVTKYADRNTVISTGWTNPTNAYADDGTNATAAPAKNNEITSEWGFPALTDGELPVGSTINSVTMEFGWYVSTTSSVATMYYSTYNGGTIVGSEQSNATEPTSETMDSLAFSTDPTESDLKTAGDLELRLRARRGNSNTAVTFYCDYVRMVVDYTPSTTTYRSYAQANVSIFGFNTYRGYAQAQASISAAAAGGPAYVQSIGSASTISSVTQLQISVSKTVTSGNTIVVAVALYSDKDSSIACADNLGNTYTLTSSVAGISPTRRIYQFVAPVTTGGTLTTITASWTTASSYISMVADEFSGLGAASDGGESSGTGTTMTWHPSGTIAANGAVIGASFSQDPRTHTAGSASGSPSTTITMGTNLGNGSTDPSISHAYAIAGGSDVTSFVGTTNNGLSTSWLGTSVKFAAAISVTTYKTYAQAQATIVFGDYESQVLFDSPSAVFPLDESSGNVVDIVGALTGTASGTPTYNVAGPIPGHTAITTTTGHFSVADATALDIGDGPFSIELWLQRDRGVSAGYPLGKTDSSLSTPGYCVQLRDGTPDTVRLQDGSTSSHLYSTADLVDDDNWHHIVFTRALATTAILYIDGAAVAVDSTAKTFTNNNLALVIGGLYAGQSYFGGNLAYVAIYKSVLSSGRVKAHYDARILAYSTLVRSDNPVAYWRLGESSGTIQSEVGSYPGTATGTPVYSSAGAIYNDSNTAITFDAAGEYFTVSHDANLNLTTNFSVELWVKWNNTSTETFDPVISKGTTGSYYININNSGFVSFDNGSTSEAISSISIGIDKWYHIVATYATAANSSKLYINGQDVTTHPGTGATFTGNTGDLYFGYHNSLTLGASSGLDEIALYNYVLTPAQVAAHYEARGYPNTGQAQALIKQTYPLKSYALSVLNDSPAMFFPMQESSGNLTDIINNNTAIVSGSPTYGATGPIAGTTSIDFDAGTQYFTVPLDLTLDGYDTTIEFWYARDTDSGTWQGIIAKPGSYGVSVNPNDYMALTKPGTGTFFNGSSAVPANGSWHHYIIQRKDAAAVLGDQRLFVDGVEQSLGYSIFGYDIDDNTNKLIIGQDPEGPFPASGKIAYLAVYKTFLSLDKINLHYNQIAGPTFAQAQAQIIADVTPKQYAQAQASITSVISTYRAYAQSIVQILGKFTYPAINTYEMVCGFEDATVGTHWTVEAGNGTISLDTTVEGRIGSNAAKLDLANDTSYTYISAYITGDYTKTITARFRFRLSSFGTTDYRLMKFNGHNYYDLSIYVDYGESKLYFANGGSYSYSSVISTNTWYTLQVVVDQGGSIAHWSLDGVAQPDPGPPTNPDEFNSIYLGKSVVVNPGALTIWLDDVVVADTWAYPIPEGYIVTDSNDNGTWMASPTFAQAQATISAGATTYRGYSQTQALIKTTYPRAFNYSQTILNDSPVAYWRLGEQGLETAIFDGAEEAGGGAGSITRDQTHVHSGSWAWKFTTSGSTAYRGHDLPDYTRYAVATFWVYAPSVPVSANNQLFEWLAYSWGAIWHNTDGYLYFYDQTGTVSSSTLPLNEWVQIEVTLDTRANPQIYDWKINGVAQTQHSEAVNADDIQGVDMGGGPTVPVDWWIDDLSVDLQPAANDEIGTVDGQYSNKPTIGVAGLLVGDSDTATNFDRSQSQSVQIRSGMPAGSTAYSIEMWLDTSTIAAEEIWCFWNRGLTTDTGMHEFGYRRWDDESCDFFLVFGGSESYDSAYAGSYTTHADGLLGKHHVVAVVDYTAKTFKVYLDGQQSSTTTDLTGKEAYFLAPPANAHSRIAGYSGNNLNMANATLDEVAIYDYPLSAAQVAIHYTAGTWNSTFAQANAQIKQIYLGYAQSQAQIKVTYRVYAQSQASIKQRYISCAQGQARIKQTYRSYAQSNAKIILSALKAYAQSQARIKQKYTVWAQGNAKIILSNLQRYAQAQTRIKQAYVSNAQAQAQIKTTYRYHAQTQATILGIFTYRVFAQSQARIKQTYQSYAQSHTRIKQTYPLVVSGGITTIGQDDFSEAIYTNIIGKSADIGGTYSNYWTQGSVSFYVYNGGALGDGSDDTYTLARLGSATDGDSDHYFSSVEVGTKGIVFFRGIDSSNYYWVEAFFGDFSSCTIYLYRRSAGGVALIAWVSKIILPTSARVRVNVTGYSPTTIRIRGWDISGSEPDTWDIDTTDNTAGNQISAGAFGIAGWGDDNYVSYMDNYLVTSSGISIEGPTFAQAQGNIKQAYQGYGQAQTQIKTTYRGYAQAKAQIKTIYRAYAQAQAQIKTTYRVWAQSNAKIILSALTAYGQAQALIKTTYRSYAQAQVKILLTALQAYAQAQAKIKQTYQGYAQAQAQIKVTYRAYAQGQALIKATYQAYAQAQSRIKQVYLGYAQAQSHIIVRDIEAFAQAGATISATGQGYAQAEVEIYIPQYARPIADISNDGWVRTIIN